MRNAVRPLAIALVRVRTLLPALIWILAILSASTALAKETRLVVELTTPENGAAYMAPAIISLEATVKLIDQNEKDKDKVKGKERYKKKSNDNKKDKGDSKSRQGQEEQEHGNPHRRVVKVEFLQGANVIGTAMVAPYVFDWGAVPAGKYVLSARAITAKGKTVEAAPVEISVGTNVAPTVMLTAPALNTVVTAPANITVSADAADSDGSVTQVEFFADGNVIGTATTIPFTIQWANVTSGSYSLTARATDNANAQTTSAPVNITVNQVAQVYYIHPDHLNTPRAITNQTGQLVWAWTNDDPFGANVPNENPSGLGNFNCNLRLPGQYFDRETNNHYNYFRDYDSTIGRYIQVDPMGLGGGINAYVYVVNNPLKWVDSLGLWSQEAHNAIIQAAFPGLAPNLIRAVQQGSLAVDDPFGQAGDPAPHAMRWPDEPVSSARDRYCKLITQNFADFLANRNSSVGALRVGAYRALGRALHPIMDSTSPVHRGFHPWSINNISQWSVHGTGSRTREDVKDLTPALLAETVNLINQLMSGANPCPCGDF